MGKKKGRSNCEPFITFNKVPEGKKVSTMLLNNEWIQTLEDDPDYNGYAS